MTIGFVCVKVHGRLQPVGTAFFIGNSKHQKVKIYVVTARHVIDGVRERYAVQSVFITYNGIDRREEYEIAVGDWQFHPDFQKRFIDVAIARFEYDFTIKTPSPVNPHRLRHWSYSSLYGHRSPYLPNVKIPPLTIGEEVMIPGLFVHHPGAEQNIPIMRKGSLAAIPPDPVKTGKGLMSALLLEIRSIGGLSGSPVIGKLKGQSPAIIGLIHGHFDQISGQTPDIEDAAGQTAKINAGIAIVVPADAIRETLDPLIQADFVDL